MKKKLLSFGLLAAGLLTASNAMADDITYTEKFSCDFENNETLFTGASRVTVANADSTAAVNGSKVVAFTTANNSTNGYSYAAYDISSYTAAASNVKIEFDCYFPVCQPGYSFYFSLRDKDASPSHAKGSNGGYSKTGAIFNIGVNRGKIGSSKSTTNNFAINSTNLVAGSPLGQWIHVTLELNVSAKTYSYNVTTMADKTTSLYSGSDVAYLDADNVNSISQIELYGCINDQTAAMDNLVISTYADASTTSYTTQKYIVDSEGTATLYSTSGAITATVGDAVSASEDDMESFTTDEGVKYVYDSSNSSDVSSLTLTSTADNNVLKLYFKEADKYTATLNLSYGSNSETRTATAYEGDEAIVYYPVCFNVDGTYYMIDRNEGSPYYGVAFTEEGTKTVTYTEYTDDDIEFYGEGESMTISGTNKRVIASGDASDGSYVSYMTGLYYAQTDELEAGSYTVEINILDRKPTQSTYVCLYDDSSNELIETIDCKGNAGVKTFDITLSESSKINIGYSSNSGSFDYIIVRKAAAQTVPVTCTNSTSLMCTYSNLTQDLVFPDNGDVKAYVAKEYDEDKDEVTMEQITEVPAGTGVVLKATSADNLSVEATVSSGLESPSKNLLQATNGNTVSTTDGTNYAYILYDGLFYNLDADYAITAGLAYLWIERAPKTTSAKGVTLVFDDQATGINSVKAADNNGKVYNLQGIEVQNPTNGLYIKNGKKYIK